MDWRLSGCVPCSAPPLCHSLERWASIHSSLPGLLTLVLLMCSTSRMSAAGGGRGRARACVCVLLRGRQEQEQERGDHTAAQRQLMAP